MNLEKLEKYIKESDYTTTELASMLGISRVMLWNYRKGNSKISLNIALELAQILEIPLEELLN